MTGGPAIYPNHPQHSMLVKPHKQQQQQQQQQQKKTKKKNARETREEPKLAIHRFGKTNREKNPQKLNHPVETNPVTVAPPSTTKNVSFRCFFFQISCSFFLIQSLTPPPPIFKM